MTLFNRRKRLPFSKLKKAYFWSIITAFLIAFGSSAADAQEFTAKSLGDYGNVTVMEVTGSYDSKKPDGTNNSLPRATIAKEFFKTHKDDYDFLVIFTNFDFLMPETEAAAFYLGVKNDTEGTGQDTYNHTEEFGSDGRLQGTIDMGNIASHATDPLAPGFEETLYDLSHEMMHRWGAHLKLRNPDGTVNTALLGKDLSHWSFLFDSGGSILYGNKWLDNGNGTFTSLYPMDQMRSYSPLDLYIMGVLDKSKVPPMLLIENPSIDPAKLPEAGVTISGTSRTITIDDIIAANGPRVPDSSTSQKSFKTAFIFITSPGAFRGDELYGIENIRNGGITRFSILTDGNAIMQVASTPKDDVPVNPGVLPPPTTPRTLPPDINEGIAWLMNHQKSDGSWMDLAETTARDTAETVRVLKSFDIALLNYQSGLLWLMGASADNIDYLARKIETLVPSGQDVTVLVQELVSTQNADGGWGSSGKYLSNPTDTSLAVRTLSAAGYSSQQVISKAIGYLKTKQNADGGWSGDDAGSTIQSTANVLSVFNIYRKTYQLEEQIAMGLAWLLLKQNADGGFGPSTSSGQAGPSTVYDTAFAALTLQELNASTDITNKALAYILSQQSADGGWNESSYQTALAVNTVYKATVDPDLSIKTADITFIPSSVTSLPSNIVINAKIWNLGRTAVSQAKATLYEGSVSEVNKIAEQAVAFPGQSSVTVTFSAMVKDGNEHRYYIVVDQDNIVKESNKLNNTAFQILSPQPTYDFEILSTDVTATPNPVDVTQDVKITSKITNKGTMNAYNVQVKYYLDIAGAPFDIATETVNIPAGTTITNEITWKANKAGENLPLTVQADPFNTFNEISETNNKASIPLTVNSSTLPNLTISYKDIVVTPTPANERGNVNISALVKNEGFSSAANIAVNFYRGVPGPNGLLIGTQTIPSLAPGQSAPASIDWTNIQESGEKIIYVQVDSANQIPEITKDDNEAFVTLNILSLPDLAISTNSIAFTPSAPKDGNAVSITVTVQNKGEQSASNVIVKASEGGAELDSKVIPSLPGNSQTTASFSYNTTGKTGAHQIAVMVDPDNAIIEQSEDNNSASRTLGVQNANLWVTEQYISPNGDGVKDNTQFFFRLETPQTVSIAVVNGKNETVRTFKGSEFENSTGGTITWDGLDDNGVVIADGQYQIKIIGSDNTTIAGLLVIVDTNRSPLTDAIGTKYLLNNNLTCMLPGITDWKWLPDESGILTTIPSTPEYANGIYSVSPDGADIIRLSPNDWNDSANPDFRYEYGGFDMAPDGEKIVFILRKYDKKTGYHSAELWSMDSDGSHLTSLDAISEGQLNNIYDVKWSPRGDFLVYRTYIYKYPPGSIESLRVIKSDGANKTIIDSGGYYDSNYITWSPDGSQIAYVFGSYDAGWNYIERITVSDLMGNKQQVFTDIREVDYTFVDYLAWLNPQKIILGVYGLAPDAFKIWLVDPTGNGDHIHVATDDTARDSIFPSPDGRYFAFTRQSYSVPFLSISDAEGNVYVRNTRTGTGTCVPRLTDIVWSRDGGKFTFSESLVTCGDCPVECNDTYGSHVIVVNAKTKGEQPFAMDMTPLGWMSGGRFLLGSVSGDADQSGWSIVLLNLETGESSSNPMLQSAHFIISDTRGLISPHERYISYYQWVDSTSVCYGRGERDLWALGSLLNLFADIRVVRQKSAVVLKGIVADLNFEGYQLEYADVKNPDVWFPVQPPSNVPVVNDAFTTWAPPYEGTFHVKLTVWDKAGNTAVSRRRVSLGQYSSITNLYKSLDIFSPNGDEVKNTVELHYRALEPVHLEFNIYDENDNLITTIFQDHTSPGDYYIEWDGKDNGKNTVPDGKYKIKVFDYEFFVAVDNTPPDVHLVLTPLKQTPDLKQIYSDLSGHVVDEKLKGWSIEHGEGNNPQEWFVYTQGSNSLVGEGGSPSQGPVQDTVISRISNQDLAWYTGKRFRIVAEDFAGNKTTRTTDFFEEKILFHVWDPENSEQYIHIEDGVMSYVRRDPDQYTINIVRTVREQIASLTVEYKKSGVWHESQTVTLPSAQSTGFVWDASQVNIENGDYIRIKAVDVLGAVFYSNEVWVRVLSSPEDGSLRFSLDIGYEEAGCGQISNKAFIEPTNIQIISGKFNAIVTPKTFSVYIQKSGEYVLLSQRNIGDGSNPFIDTSGLPEGSYPIEAFLTYTVTFFEGDNTRTVSKEAQASGTLAVDRVLSTAQITYPTKSSMLCTVKNTDAKGDWYGLPIEGIATDNNNIQYYELYYGIGENPTAWLPATTRSNGKSVAIKETKSVQGRLGVWDVTDLHGTTYSLKLKVVDAAGNVSCYTTSFSIDTLTEISNLTIDKNLFSPNGDGILDDVKATYQIDEYATVAVKVFKLLQGASGAVLDSTPVRTIVSGMQHLGGTESTTWDGKGDADTALPDGQYGIAVLATDSCGNTNMKWTGVEVDNTLPATIISYPKPADPLGNIVEVTGTADDLHFQNYILEAGQGDNPDTWIAVSGKATPVKNDILGKWNTFGLDGRWTLRLTAIDAVGNKNTGTITIDLGARKNLIKDLEVAPKLFSPNNDGKLDTTIIQYELTDACQVKIDILSSTGAVKITYTTSTPSLGSYTYTWDGKDSAGLVVPDGAYTVKLNATLTPNASVTQDETITVIVDSTLPTIDIKQPGNNSYSAVSGLTVNGTISDLNLVTYLITNTDDSGTSAVDQASQARENYIFSVLNDLPEGSYTLNVNAKDLGENEINKNIIFTIDRTPPSVKLETPKDDEYYGAVSPVVNSQQSGVISIAGSMVEKNLEIFNLRYGLGEQPAQWTDLLSGSTVPVSPQLFAWSIGQGAGIPDGVYTLSLYAKDKAGLTGEAKVKITIDNTAPTVLITSPQEGGYVKGAVDVKGTAFDQNLDKYTVEISEGQCSSAVKWAALKTVTTSVQDGTLTNWQALPTDGDYCLRVTAVDKVGTSSEAKINVKVDTHPPAAPVLSGAVESKTSASLTWMANMEPDIAGYNLYRSNQKVNTALITEIQNLDQNLAEGNYEYTVKAVDNAGWESEASNIVKIKIDLIGPTARIRSPQDGARISNVIDIKGTAYSDDDFKQYRIYIGQGASPSAWNLIRTSPLSVSYGVLAQWDTLEIAEGEVYNIKLEAEDSSGNVNTNQITVAIDNTAPAKPVIVSAIASAADATVTWNANAETDLAGYLLYRNDQLANVSGIVIGDLKPYLISGSSYLDISLPDGAFKYYVVAVDQAGNMSAPSEIRDVTIDTHPPHAVITDPSDQAAFGGKIMVKAETPDLDVAFVQFEFKKVLDSAWTSIGSPVTAQPFATYLDPVTLGLAYGDYNLRAVAADKGNKTDPAPSMIIVTYKDLMPPAAPQGLMAKTNGGTITLTWTANAESDLDGYNVYRTSGSTKTKINTAIVQATDQPTYQDGGVADGTHIYEVTAVDTNKNESSPSGPAIAKVYAPVIMQPYTPVGQSASEVRGTKAAANGTTELFAETASGPVSLGTTTADSAGAFVMSVVLAPGENRLFARVTDSAGNVSRDSNTAVVVYNDAPAAPTGLAASVQDHDVNLTWNQNLELDILGYNLFRNGVKVNVSDAVAPILINASSSFDPYNFTPYQAMDQDPCTYWMPQDGTSAANPAWWEMDLASPELISHVEMHWGSDFDASGNEVLYAGMDFEVQVWSADANSWITKVKVAGNAVKNNVFDFKPAYRTDKIRVFITDSTDANSAKQVRLAEVAVLKDSVITQTAYDDLNLPDKQYDYTVTAVNLYGFESLPSEKASETVGDVVPPSEPQGLTATPVNSDVILMWSANPEPDVAGYNAYRSTAQGWQKINSSLIIGSSSIDAGLPNGTYIYRITAVDGVGNESSPSNEASAAVYIVPPAEPATLNVTPTPEGGLNASWIYNGGPVAGYNLYRSMTSGGSYTKVNSSRITNNSYLDTGLTSGVTYYYVVAAVDFAGNVGIYSNEASGTPLDTVAPAKPALFFPTVAGTPVTLHENKTDIFGSADPGAVVNLFKNGAFAGWATAQAQDVVRTFAMSDYGDNGASISPDGKTLAYYAENNSIWLKTPATGSVKEIVPGGYLPLWSPDGTRIAYSYWNNAERIGIYDVTTGASAPLTNDTQVTEYSPSSWSADGAKLVFTSYRNGSYSVWLKDFTSGALTKILDNVTDHKLSPDGTKLAYFEGPNLHIRDIATGDDLLADDNTDEYSIDWSSDGKELAFVSYRNGNGDVYILNIADGTQTLVSGSSGYPYYPKWARDGRHVLFYLWDAANEQDTVWLADVRAQSLPRRIMNDLRYVPYIGCSKTGVITSIGLNAAGVFTAHVLDLQGGFTFNNIALSPGESSFTATASDGTGNTSPLSDAISVALDAGSLPDLAAAADDVYLYPPYPIAGEQMSVNVSVWNNGAVEVRDVDIAVYLWNAAGNLELLKSQRIPVMAPQSAELITAVWDSTGKIGDNRLVVVIDPEDKIVEIVESNNIVIKDFFVAALEGVSMSTVTDGAQYSADQNAMITITVRNSGARVEGIIEARIEDEQGYPVQTFEPLAVTLPYASGQKKMLTWNTGSTYAGSYRVHATFKNASAIGAENTVPFVILSDVAIDSSLVTDKVSYMPGENVTITGAISHQGKNSIIPALTARIAVKDAAGSVFFADEKSMTNLLPGSMSSFFSGWNTGLSPAGIYRVIIEVIVDGNTILTRTTSFTVRESALMSGMLTLSPSIVPLGQTFQVTYNLRNGGNADALGVTAKVMVIDPETGEIQAEVTSQETGVRRGESVQGTATGKTQGLARKTYTLVLQYSDSTTTLTLATASMTVKDMTAPQVTVISPTTESVYVSTIPIIVTVSDNASGVDYVEYQRDNGTWSLLPVSDPSVNRFGVVWEPTMAEDGIHSIGIRATDKAGNISVPVTVSFTIDINRAPTAPSLAQPADGADVESLTPVLAVNNASDPNDDPLTYEFEVYADNGLSNLIVSSGPLPAGSGITAWTVSAPLIENHAYYWRARAYDGKLYGAWMTIFDGAQERPASFRVNAANDAPTAPGISSPADGSSVDTLTPALVITNASDPDSMSLTYNFDVALDPGFTQIVASIKGVLSGPATTSWQVPVNLSENTTYYWRAQADDWLIEGPWSKPPAAFFVNTANDPPTVPVIIAPVNNPEVTTLSPDIVIFNSTDADSSALTYFFEVDTVPTFDTPGIIRSGSIPQGQNTTIWQAAGLQDNTQYYVRVKANDGVANGDWTEPVGFFANTANDAPTVPVLANPSDGAMVNVFNPTLTVQNAMDIDRDVLTYAFELYADAALTVPVASASGIAETPQMTFWTVPVMLTENHTYYWRAGAFDGQLFSGWTSLVSFTVNTGNDAPSAPRLSSPANGSSLETLTPTLAVQNATDPDSDTLTYNFEIYSNDVLVATKTGVPQDSSGITTWTPDTNLQDNTAYTWLAQASDGDRGGPWMDRAEFSIHIPKTGITATIDFDPNTLNKTSKGTWVVVYIELPAGYKPRDVDISSVRLEGTVPAESWPYAIGDHDKDGIPDLMVKFKRSDVINLLPNGEQVPVHVTGKVGSTTFEGVDVIRVIP